PRLSSMPQRRTAIAAGLIALVLIPFTPAGVPILLSMFGVAAALLPPSLRPPGRGGPGGRTAGQPDRSGRPA
ncbi:MAG: branched-chain amino acid ABC transporter permease, partial [Ilumatobacteraceae bacterium]